METVLPQRPGEGAKPRGEASCPLLGSLWRKEAPLGRYGLKITPARCACVLLFDLKTEGSGSSAGRALARPSASGAQAAAVT